MDEKKLIYRLKTDIKPSGYNIPKMFADEIKALAALPKSMQDELSRPFPKWVADAMLTDLDRLFPRGLSEVMSGVGSIGLMAEQGIAHYQQMAEAENILGIDRSRPETVEPWYFMPESMVLQEAKRLKGVQQQARQLTERGTLTLILRSLDDLPESAQEQLYRLLETRQSKKQKRGGGPVATPIDDQIRIVEGWFKVKGRMPKEVYAAKNGVDQSTLYRWEQELRKSGLL